MRDTARKRLFGLAATICGGLFLLPLAYRYHAGAASKLHSETTQNTFVSAQLQNLERQQAQRKPVLLDKELTTSLRSGTRQFIGEILQFVNNVAPTVSLDTVKVGVDTGVIQIDTQAKAISYKAAAEFVSATGKIPGAKETNLTAMKSDNAFSPDGVTFELSSKIGVGR
jgi:methylphosphotriester-DNA--protein-cysteine methyltransferase